MAKKRKTRQEKMKADLRHSSHTPYTVEYLPNPLPKAHPKPTTAPLRIHAYAETAYVMHDLIKTSVITAAIIIAQLVAFLTLR